jgi:TonB family protein
MIESSAKTEGNTSPRRRGILNIEEYCPPPPPAQAPSKETVPLITPLFRERGTRLGLGALILFVHVEFAWLVAQQGVALTRLTQSVVPLTIFPIAPLPRARVSTDMTIETPPPLDINIEQLTLGNLDVPETAKSIAHSSGSTIAPRPADPLRDSKSFAQQARLKPGVGVTVVLRVEVLTSGSVGRVEVDVSGGSDPIDAAAIAYVRSLKWIGGRIDDQPETIWIRWGVQLNG